jgi:hypothetical protein
MIFRFLITSIVLLSLSACGSSYNYKEAHYTKTQNSYLIEVKGKRRLMAHDPISLLMGKTYEAKQVFEVPRIEGIVKGSEIPRLPGYYKYVGTIKFENQSMVIDLYADNYDEKKKNVSWNGVYVLKQMDSSAN